MAERGCMRDGQESILARPLARPAARRISRAAQMAESARKPNGAIAEPFELALGGVLGRAAPAHRSFRPPENIHGTALFCSQFRK